jgi:hypothetical protein
MTATTVENHSQTVVNTGTEHTAQSEDECQNGIHQNSAYSKDLVFGTTSVRTQIAKNWIAMEYTIWGKSESGGIKGVKTGQTQSIAMVYKGSRDLKVEGRWAARRDDPSLNNFFNSKGQVIKGFVKPEEGSQEERAKRKCFLAKWTGKTAGKKSRSLGYKGKDKTGKPNWLEVYDDDTLIFEATRQDITDPNHPDKPKCAAEEQHTIWTATGTRFPTLGEKVAPREVGKDKFVFDANMFLDLFANSDFMAAVEQGDMEGALNYAAENWMSKYATNDGDPDMRAQDYGADNDLAPDHAKGANTANAFGTEIPTDATTNWLSGDGKTNDWTKPEDGKWSKEKNDPEEDADKAYGKKTKVREVIPSNWPTILFYFWWWLRSPEIKVTASSCGDGREATIKVHPKQKCKFDINLTPVARAIGKKGLKKQRQARKAAQNQAYKANEAAKDQAAQAQQAVDQWKQKYGQAQAKRTAARHHMDNRSTPGSDEWNEAGDEFIKQINLMIKFKAKWDKAQRQLDQAKATLDTTGRALDLAKKISTTAGSPMNVRFCENLKLEVKLSYEPTSERNSGMGWRWYTPACMGQRWEFKLQVQPLIKVTYRIYFSLLNFLLVWAPGAAQILRRFRVVRVDLYFMISMSISVSGITVTKTEHDDIEIGGPEVSGDVIPRFGLVAGAGGVDIIDGYISAPINFNFVFVKPNKKGQLMLLSPQVRITNHYRIVLFPDRWWEIEATSGRFKNLFLYYNTSGRSKLTIGSVPA